MTEFALTGSCRLHALRESDAEELHAVIDANREHLARWLAWAQDQTLADTRTFIARASRQEAGNGGFHRAIVERGRIIGMIGYHGIDWDNRSAMLGYWLARDVQGKGTMTTALRTLVDHAFAELALNRIEVRLDVENDRSRAVVERLGFRHEGILRQAMRIAGSYRDDALYAMLACDWPTGSGAEPERRVQRAEHDGLDAVREVR